ncbi:hypothetical protein KJ780_03685 [Candidatus Micrarchaeota archaeon]|nr:hypothetical protein [Candidatus Micrarchaeota archaeon]
MIQTNGKAPSIGSREIFKMRQANLDKVAAHANGMARVMMNPRREWLKHFMIFDTTGRDGMQTYKAFANPNVPRTESKKRVITELAGWGVPAIEVGYPGASTAENQVARAIVEFRNKAGLETVLVGLSMTIPEHVKIAKEVGMDEIHIFSSGSVPHAWVKFGKMPHELTGDVVETVKFARSIGFEKILVSLEDAFSADPDHLVEVALRCADAAKDAEFRYNIPDTIGVATPEHAFALTSFMIDKTGIPLDVHFHNDSGLAAHHTVVAACAAAEKGQAIRGQTTINGLGERTGNAALHLVLKELHQFWRVVPKDVKGKTLELNRLFEISRFVANLAGIPIPANAPAIGEDSSVHNSGPHANGYMKSLEMGRKSSIYVPENPRTYGNKERVETGPLAGKSNTIVKMKQFGIDVKHPKIKSRMDEIAENDKSISASRHVSDAEFILNAFEIIMGKQCGVLKIDERDIEIIMGGNWPPRARVKIEINGEEKFGEAMGNGPVNAVISAITNAIGQESLKFANYDNHSLGTGSDATAEVELVLENGCGPIRTSCIGPNTTIIAIEAYAQAFNALEALKQLRALSRE